MCTLEHWVVFQAWYPSIVHITVLIQVYSIFQSVGACSDTCRGYTFAILQGHVSSLRLVDLLTFQLCWCSNYSPDVFVSSKLCNESCPGFPNGIHPIQVTSSN